MMVVATAVVVVVAVVWEPNLCLNPTACVVGRGKRAAIATHTMEEGRELQKGVKGRSGRGLLRGCTLVKRIYYLLVSTLPEG